MSEDYGKESRENYRKAHKDEDERIDKAYEEGEDQPTPDQPVQYDDDYKLLRRKIAKRAAEYQRPARGYVDGDSKKGPVEGQALKPSQVTHDPAKERVFGGGVYLNDVPATDKERCDNTYKWVEDVFWPKQPSITTAPTNPSDRKLNENWKKLTEIDKVSFRDPGTIDIGKRMDPTRRTGWYCSELAEFLAYLLRELGYKVQYKNIIPSLSESGSGEDDDVTVQGQTSAINVWYGGAWHFYDPFFSFSEADGGTKAYIDKDKKGNPLTGTLPHPALPFHDVFIFEWARPNYKGFEWVAPNKTLKRKTLKDAMKQKGWDFAVMYSQAGVSLRNTSKEIRMGLRVGETYCGYTGNGEVVDSLKGAVYRPFGRAIPGCPARPWMKDEFITYNVDEPGNYGAFLDITNVSAGKRTAFYIDVYPSSSDGARLVMKPRPLRGSLAPGQSRRLPIPFRVQAVAVRVPEPVTNLKARLLPGSKVLLQWVSGRDAESYAVYRRIGHTITDAGELARATLIGETVATCFEDHTAAAGLIYYAVLSRKNAGGISGLDPEQSSSAYVEIGADE